MVLNKFQLDWLSSATDRNEYIRLLGKAASMKAKDLLGESFDGDAHYISHLATVRKQKAKEL